MDMCEIIELPNQWSMIDGFVESHSPGQVSQAKLFWIFMKTNLSEIRSKNNQPYVLFSLDTQVRVKWVYFQLIKLR